MCNMVGEMQTWQLETDTIRADGGYLFAASETTLSLWLQLLSTGWDQMELRGQHTDKTWDIEISHTGGFKSSSICILGDRKDRA